jgi:archaellum component FlaC
MAVQGYSISIKAVDGASSVVKKLDSNLKNSGKGAKDLNAQSKSFHDVMTKVGKSTSFNNLSKATKELTTGVLGAVSNVTKLAAGLAGIGTVASIGGIIAATNQFSNFTRAIDTNSRAIGIAPQKLEAFQQVAERSGVSAETAASSLRGMSAGFRDAYVNGGQARQILNDIGMSTEDIGAAMKDPVEGFKKLIPLLNKLPDGPMKQHVIEMLKMQDLQPILNDGVDKFDDRWKQVQHTLNSDQKTIDTMKDQKDAIAGLTQEAEHLGRSLLTTAAPSITTVANSLKDELAQAMDPTVKNLDEWIKKNQALIDQDIKTTIHDIVADVKELWPHVNNVVKSLGGWKTCMEAFAVFMGARFAASILLPFIQVGFYAAKTLGVLKDISGIKFTGGMGALGWLGAAYLVATELPPLLNKAAHALLDDSAKDSQAWKDAHPGEVISGSKGLQGSTAGGQPTAAVTKQGSKGGRGGIASSGHTSTTPGSGSGHGGGYKFSDDDGDISAKYESGGRGVGTISTGVGDKGGVSYGTHQLASKTGTMQAFVNSPEGKAFAASFKGLTPGSPEFNAAYKQVVATSGDAFEKAQNAFIGRTHAQPVFDMAQGMGFDTSNPAIRKALYSQSVQSGQAGNKTILENAKASGVDMNDSDAVIKSIYKARGDYASQYASGSATRDRYARESKDVLSANHQVAPLKPVAPLTAPNQVATNDSKTETHIVVDFKNHPPGMKTTTSTKGNAAVNVKTAASFVG